MFLKLKVIAVAIVCLAIDADGSREAMRRMRNTMGGFLQAKGKLGCLKVTCEEAGRISKLCMTQRMFGELKSEDDQPDIVECLKNITICSMEHMGAIKDDGTIDMDGLNKFYNENPLVGDEKDLAVANEIGKKCLEANSDKKNAVEFSHGVHQCFFKQIYEECEKRNQETGLMLPIYEATNSLLVKNERCRFVKGPAKIDETLNKCMESSKNKKNDFVDRVAPIIGDFMADAFKTMKHIMNEFRKLPEIACRMETLNQNNIFINGKYNPEGVRKFLSEFEGFEKKEGKEELVSKAYECAEKYKDLDMYQSMAKTHECFLPTMTNVCGYDNVFAWKYMYPFISYEFLDSIKKRITDSFENSAMKKLMSDM